MFEKQQRKIKRSARLISILSKYGFRDVMTRLNIRQDLPEDGTIEGYTTSERIRMALEELGPTFVKLGQAFSDRDDLLEPELLDQLRMLQDKVQTLELDVEQLMIDAFGEDVIHAFDSLKLQPIAAASIAQVYKARLVNGPYVILKIKRPGIDATIADDILILKDLISLIDTYSDIVEQINLKSALTAFEKSLLEELSLKHEAENLKEFYLQFEGDKEIYVPKIYSEWSNDTILTMEYIDGTKITNLEQLDLKGHNRVKISELGYRLFVTQILEFGFFHADPHSGNLMVNDAGQLVFLDFGAMGRIPKMDQPLFENLILSFMANKPHKVVRILKKMSLFYKIPDERLFEMDVMEILNTVHQSALKDIDINFVINKMKEVLKTNRLVMPEYFYLLFKGISLMDGVGRKLNPDLDVVSSLKPYTKEIIKKKLSPERLAKEGKDRITDLLDHIEEIPKELRSLLSKLDENQFKISTNLTQYERFENLVKTSVINIILGLVLSANIVATGLIYVKGNLIITVLSIIFSIILIIIITLRILRR